MMSPGASEGALLRLNKLGSCLRSSFSRARYLSIRALKSVTYHFNGISLKNNYFTVPIIQFVFDVSLLITCRIFFVQETLFVTFLTKGSSHFIKNMLFSSVI